MVMCLHFPVPSLAWLPGAQPLAVLQSCLPGCVPAPGPARCRSRAHPAPAAATRPGAARTQPLTATMKRCDRQHGRRTDLALSLSPNPACTTHLPACCAARPTAETWVHHQGRCRWPRLDHLLGHPPGAVTQVLHLRRHPRASHSRLCAKSTLQLPGPRDRCCAPGCHGGRDAPRTHVLSAARGKHTHTHKSLQRTAAGPPAASTARPSCWRRARPGCPARAACRPHTRSPAHHQCLLRVLPEQICLLHAGGERQLACC